MSGCQRRNEWPCPACRKVHDDERAALIERVRHLESGISGVIQMCDGATEEFANALSDVLVTDCPHIGTGRVDGSCETCGDKT